MAKERKNPKRPEPIYELLNAQSVAECHSFALGWCTSLIQGYLDGGRDREELEVSFYHLMHSLDKRVEAITARTSLDNLRNPARPDSPKFDDPDEPYILLRPGRQRVILNDDGEAAETKP